MSRFDSPEIEALVDHARNPFGASDTEEAVTNALADNSLSDHDRGQLLLAQVVGSQGDLGSDQAMSMAVEAVSLLRRTSDDEALTSALAVAAAITAASGDRSKCLELCLDMSSIIRARPQMEVPLRASIGFGASLVVLGAYDLAVPLFAHAIDESTKNNDPSAIILSSANLAMTLSRQRLVSNSAHIAASQTSRLDLIEKSVGRIEATELNPEIRTFRTAVLTEVATLRGDLDHAVRLWGDLDALSAHTAQSFVQYFCLVEAPLAAHQENFDRAHVLVERTLEYLATPHIVPLGRIDALDLRSRIHERQGNLAAALLDARKSCELALSETVGMADLLIGQVDQRAILEATQRALIDHTTHLSEQAFLDELSQVGNRRAYESAIEELRTTSRSDVTVLICDIDGFKKVNDRYGHTIGDAVIRRVGALATRATGSADRAFRYGGDEFVLLPGPMPLTAALALARQICDSFAQEPWTELGIDESLTCSIGVWVGPSSDIDAGLREADAQLYAAKRAGRNCARPSL